MGRVGRAFTVVRRAWGEFVGPEAGTRESVVILGVAAVGAAAAPAVVRRRGGASRWDEVVAGVLALDLWGGAWANNTRACARWYERPGQGDAEHYGFAALHVHPVLVVWLDRAEPRRVPGWAWAGAHYAYLVVATVAIRRLSRHRRVLGVALTAGGLVLDRVLGASVRAPWFAAAYYPKLLLGHAAAALWNDAALGRAGSGRARSLHPDEVTGSIGPATKGVPLVDVDRPGGAARASAGPGGRA
jgi:hypothetical protein